jgi:hypothetical protein
MFQRSAEIFGFFQVKRTKWETEMTFDEEKRGWAFARAEGLEKRIAACEKLAETEAQREELASMRRRLADMRGK